MTFKATYLGDLLLYSLPLLSLFQHSCPEALNGAPRPVHTTHALLLLPLLSRTLLSFPLLLFLFSESPELPAVLLFESSYFLDILVVESFPQRLKLRRQANMSTGPP